MILLLKKVRLLIYFTIGELCSNWLGEAINLISTSYNPYGIETSVGRWLVTIDNEHYYPNGPTMNNFCRQA